MKKTHKTKLERLIKKERDNIFVPNFGFARRNSKADNIQQKMIEILPELYRKGKRNREIPLVYDQLNADSHVLSFKKSEKKTSVYTTPLSWKTRSLKPSEFVINMSDVDKSKLLHLAKTRQIKNKIEKVSENDSYLILPAYEKGLNIMAGISKLIEGHAGKDSPLKDIVSVFDNKDAESTNTDVKDGQVEANKNQTPLKEDASSAQSQTVTVVGDSKNSGDQTAAVVGENNQGEIVTDNSVVPEKNVKQLPPQQPKGNNDAPKPQDVKLEGGNTEDLNAKNEKKAKEEEKNGPEAAGAGAKRAVGLIKDVAMAAGVVATGGVGAAALAPELGAVGEVVNVASKAGDAANAAQTISGVEGEKQSQLNPIPAPPAAGGTPGGIPPMPGGGVNPMGMLSMVGMGPAMGPMLAMGGLMAAGGIAAAGVGALASGLGSLISNSPGMKLLDSLFGDDEEKDKNQTVINNSTSSPTTITNVVNQYDIYRKTADDSFMLPNYRREYG